MPQDKLQGWSSIFPPSEYKFSTNTGCFTEKKPNFSSFGQILMTPRGCQRIFLNWPTLQCVVALFSKNQFSFAWFKKVYNPGEPKLTILFEKVFEKPSMVMQIHGGRDCFLNGKCCLQIVWSGTQIQNNQITTFVPFLFLSMSYYYTHSLTSVLPSHSWN